MTEDAQELACSLDAAALQDRRSLFQERLLSHALSTARIDRGLIVTFPNDADLVTEIRTIIDLERQCCGFLEFDLKEDIESSRVLLTITGPVNARSVLARFESAFLAGVSGVER